jgi:hypothetical protein
MVTCWMTQLEEGDDNAIFNDGNDNSNMCANVKNQS